MGIPTKPSRSGNATENIISVRDLVVVQITNSRIVMMIASGSAIGRRFRQSGNQFQKQPAACLHIDPFSKRDR